MNAHWVRSLAEAHEAGHRNGATDENARVLALLDSYVEQTTAQAAALVLDELSTAEPVAQLQALRLLREALKL